MPPNSWTDRVPILGQAFSVPAYIAGSFGEFAIGPEKVDLAHPPGTQQPQNPVTGESLTDPQRHGRMLAAAIAVPDHFRYRARGPAGPVANGVTSGPPLLVHGLVAAALLGELPSEIRADRLFAVA